MAARDAELNALLQRWLFAGMAVAIATGLGLVGRAYFQASGGALVYWIEDAYIHLAMARNLALHGVFGATPHEFTTSSSSPLWVLLLEWGGFAALWLAGRRGVGGSEDPRI